LFDDNAKYRLCESVPNRCFDLWQIGTRLSLKLAVRQNPQSSFETRSGAKSEKQW
jgi:hypothetical protein